MSDGHPFIVHDPVPVGSPALAVPTRSRAAVANDVAVLALQAIVDGTHEKFAHDKALVAVKRIREILTA